MTRARRPAQPQRKPRTSRALRPLGLFCVLSLAFSSALAQAQPACLAAFAFPQKSLPRISKVSFVVPVYRELENGNIQAFLRRLDGAARENAKMTNVSVSAVFAVNNTKEIAQDPTSLVYRENQSTLEYLEKERKSQLHPYEIKIVDLSTQGTERNMGVIRENAVTQLLSDSKVDKEKHALVHMDVDTKLPHHFFSNLVNAFGEAREVVFFARSYELRDEPRTPLIKSHPDYKRKRAWRDLQILLGGFRQGVATYQISSRASTHLQVGGFKPLVQGEDTQLSKDLISRPFLLESKIVVATEDRSRPDGFTSALRWEGLSGVAPRKNHFPRLLFLDSWIDRAENLIQQGQVSEATAERAFQNLVMTEFGFDLSKSKRPGSHLRERYKTYLYEKSETPSQTAYESFTSKLPPSEQALFNRIRDSKLKELADTEKLRRSVLQKVLIDPPIKLSKTERLFAEKDPFLSWLKGEGSTELKMFLENGQLNREKLRASEPALADWVTPTDARSLFREHASLVALYDGLAKIDEDPRLAPTAAAKLNRLREGPR